jgi:four helix bundle protein
MRKKTEAGVKYEDWESTIPGAISRDPLWKVTAYRLALFIGDISWHDVCKLYGDQRTKDLSDQLYRALGSISANISEGYSRNSGRDRVRFYEYALGSARESRGWYHLGRHILGPEVITHRFDLLEQIARLLLTMIPEQRQQAIRDESIAYHVNENRDPGEDSLTQVLSPDVPYP